MESTKDHHLLPPQPLHHPIIREIPRGRAEGEGEEEKERIIGKQR